MIISTCTFGQWVNWWVYKKSQACLVFFEDWIELVFLSINMNSQWVL